MAKSSGLGDNCYVGGYDLSGDIGSLSKIGGGPAALDVTSINQSAHDRVGGHRDAGIDFTAWWNDAAGAMFPALSPLTTADVIVSYFRGTTQGNAAASMVAKQVNFDPTRGQDGSLSVSVNALGNAYGLEWGRMLTAGVRADTTATNGTAYLDPGGATTTFGLQAYLHVFAFTGTSVTVKLQESSDNAGDAYADVVGGGFTAATAIGAQRIATATGLSVEKYLRVVTTGTFTVANFAVMVVRNTAVPAF